MPQLSDVPVFGPVEFPCSPAEVLRSYSRAFWGLFALVIPLAIVWASWGEWSSHPDRRWLAGFGVPPLLLGLTYIWWRKKQFVSLLRKPSEETVEVLGRFRGLCTVVYPQEIGAVGMSNAGDKELSFEKRLRSRFVDWREVFIVETPEEFFVFGEEAEADLFPVGRSTVVELIPEFALVVRVGGRQVESCVWAEPRFLQHRRRRLSRLLRGKRKPSRT